MTNLDDRRKGFEADFQRKQELEFRIAAHRNRLLGRWAAALLGMDSTERTEDYAAAVIAADLQAPGDDDVIAKISGDFEAAGLAISAAEIRAELLRAETIAREQLAAR